MSVVSNCLTLVSIGDPGTPFLRKGLCRELSALLLQIVSLRFRLCLRDSCHTAAALIKTRMKAEFGCSIFQITCCFLVPKATKAATAKQPYLQACNYPITARQGNE